MLNGLLACVLLLTAAGTAIAQDQPSGTEEVLWTRFSFGKKLSPRLKASVAPHFIFGSDISRVSSMLTDFGLSYKIVPAVSVSGTYRLVLRFPEGADPVTSRHQLLLNLSASQKVFSRFKVYYRVRYQSQSPEMLSFMNEEGLAVRHFLRNRVKMRYSVNYYLRPWVSYELFHRMGHRNRGTYLRNDRLLLGLDYRFDQRNRLNLFAGTQNRLDRNDRPTRLIFGTTWSHDF